MGIVHDEYDRFMQWAREVNTSPDARRVAKVIQESIDDVISSVSAGGQRATVLTRLLRQNLLQTGDQIEEIDRAEQMALLPWTKLQKLTVGPFRGFCREEQFDLRKSVVLFSGPNGSGKTSICEALEFALLGHVEEASVKRIESLEQYFDNIHAGGHAKPELLAQDGNNGAPVAVNEELLRFAIIEKNRIEGFARLAARTPAQANALIAALFGLDSFNEFVNNFTSTLDRQLRLDTPLKDYFATKLQALKNANERIENSQETLKAFDDERKELTNDLEEDCTDARLLELIGTPDQPGRLQEITKLLEEQIPAQTNLNRSGVVTMRRLLRSKQVELSQVVGMLKERAAQVSYRDLYVAVQSLEREDPNSCPACETPIEHVAVNPFERASEGLILLQDLAEIEENQSRLSDECNVLSLELRESMLKADQLGALQDATLEPLVAWIRNDDHIPIWKDDVVTKVVWLSWLRVVQKLESSDIEIQQRIRERDDLIKERDLLEQIKEKLLDLNGRRSQHVAQMSSEEEFVDKFDENFANLIARVSKEDEHLQSEVRIQTAYADYLSLIRNYRDDLPRGLMADLNETTRDLYNKINAHDHESDKLASLALPLRGGERIEISFCGAPNSTHDALLVLSEGHLRCLGLAILLAKNIKLELPLIVFDDAVNAIDHDHRAGIRATIFGDERIRSKQIFITCHSNEFIKDIQNQLGEQASKLYVLNHHSGDHQPRVQGGADRHYLTQARDRLNDGDQRQCLAYCRQALENLSSRTWKSLCGKSNELGFMHLGLRSPTSVPELRELTDMLKRKIETGRERAILTSDAWIQRHEGLQEILDIPEGHLAWQYFNKGTHDEEDREDFEVQIVSNIVDALTKISMTFNA